jgi:hypothetical protein
VATLTADLRETRKDSTASRQELGRERAVGATHTRELDGRCCSLPLSPLYAAPSHSCSMWPLYMREGRGRHAHPGVRRSIAFACSTKSYGCITSGDRRCCHTPRVLYVEAKAKRGWHRPFLRTLIHSSEILCLGLSAVVGADKHQRILGLQTSLAQAVAEQTRMQQALEAERLVVVRLKRESQETIDG